jgi:penicillin-binding protein 1A
MGNGIQVVSPQNAYIMTKIMEKTVDQGTLAHGAGWGSKFTYKDESGRTFKLPTAGKTGTPQNWSDAWAVGYSPYYTTAVWFGFDKPGNSLGVDLTGSSLSGPVWGDYMREIHRGLPRRDFPRPASGIIDVTVCVKSGLLKTTFCNEGEVTLPFLEGTQPGHYCELHGNAAPIRIPVGPKMFVGREEAKFVDSLRMPELPDEIRAIIQNIPQPNANQDNRRTNRNNTNSRTPQQNPSALSNPMLDNDAPASNTRPEPDQFPDTAVQFVPDQSGFQSDDSQFEEKYSGEYDDGLPSWNPLDF